MRRAFTLIEAMIALIIAALIIETVWSSLHLVTVGDRVADREAARALEEARAMELLLRDLRSASKEVEQVGGGDQFVFKRWVKVNDQLEERTVSWKVVQKSRIVRHLEGQPEQSFQFDLRVEDSKAPFRLRIDKILKADFKGGTTPVQK